MVALGLSTGDDNSIAHALRVLLAAQNQQIDGRNYYRVATNVVFSQCRAEKYASWLRKTRAGTSRSNHHSETLPVA
jgi:hypothetical protein